ncbi:CrcB family protein [Quadrisphaera sp. INWT6]|uniref:fluoride efflux transporter FluC n=1 Tax=Quadrisphaera sp. INWT6 TaxID=2596917 RepID=UPI00189285EC|nr:CrcB family protein [Quadrisphaera sp. INWT6]MBF5083039.1 CrcB family protein [Quadrisphaera sp. INWT6]
MTAVVVLLAVVAGGLGAGLRFVVDGALRARWAASLPVATTVINTTGSFALGLLVGLAQAHATPATETAQAVLGTGLLGGYTTFSTASVEVVALLRDRRRGAAALHAVTMLGGSVAAAAVGLAVGTALG